MHVVCLTICAGQILAMSNKHLYDAVCSLVCRSELLLTWCEQINSNCSEAAAELRTSVSTLLKVFAYYCIYAVSISLTNIVVCLRFSVN